MPTKTKETNETNEIKKDKKVAKITKTTVSKTPSKSNNKKAKKSTTKSSTTSKKAISSAKTSQKKTSQKKTASTAKVTKKKFTQKNIELVEYYDLPYRYNETVVKILYQTPDTLFVYWDVSDKDRENYIKQYGENFFNITRPVLIIHNETMNYSFEIPINDFANSWYFRINDSKCNYRVELGRRPNYYNKNMIKEIEENIHSDYIHISNSNKIESPNDHVLFTTNENNTIKFRNIKNNQENSVSLYDIVKKLPALKNSVNIPYISKELFKVLYTGIYQNEDISLFERISNPSSGGNPSSGSMSSRFI